MGPIASQITSLTIVYSTVYSDTDQRKHQSSASLAFLWGSMPAFPAQMASNTENVSIGWRHHESFRANIWKGHYILKEGVVENWVRWVLKLNGLNVDSIPIFTHIDIGRWLWKITHGITGLHQYSSVSLFIRCELSSGIHQQRYCPHDNFVTCV